MPQAPERKRMHRFDNGSWRFLTFSCYHRLPLFRNDRIKDEFVTAMARWQRQHAVVMAAWVVMPEHVHLLLWPGPRGTMLAPRLAGLKSSFARTIIQRWRALDARILTRISHKGVPRFWERGGGFDRNLRSDRAIERAMSYIHANPVKRGLASRPHEYRWSSAWRDQHRMSPILLTNPWTLRNRHYRRESIKGVKDAERRR